MEIISHYLHWILYGFIGFTECHQMLDRTAHFDKKPLFICCRCSAIYTGYFISYLFIYLTGKSKTKNFPPRKVIIIGAILSSLMFFDVGSVMTGLRHGANDIRIITGLLAGSSFVFLIIPILNRLLGESKDERRVMPDMKTYLFVTAINIIPYMLIKTEWSFLFYPFSVIIGTGLILDYINLNSIGLLLFLRLFKIYRLNIIIVITAALCLSFIEKIVTYKLFIMFHINNP